MSTSGRGGVPAIKGEGRGARSLTRFAWLSISAALTTMALKTVAWAVTGSVGLLSDAAESVVNLVAAVVALIALTIVARPPDAGHNFGHGKAEYFSASVEGVMIFVAAVAIIVAALERLIHPRPLDNVGAGLVVSAVAGVVNGVVAMLLIRAGREHRSLALTADGRHLLTDVWTSVGVIGGVLAVAVTGVERIDPVIALLVGVNITVTGVRLLSHSVSGLMDHAIPSADRAALDVVLGRFEEAHDVAIHAVRTREAGRDQLVSLHLVVPGDWPVSQGHSLVGELESAIEETLPYMYAQTHLEPRGARCASGPDPRVGAP